MALEELRQLRDHAAAVLGVIDARGLEGATHITPRSALAHQCRDELENGAHYLTQLLFDLPHVNGQEGRVLALPLDSLTIEQHSIAQAADGLLRDADMALFGGESWEHRQHFGTTTVSPIVCKQLREGIALLDRLFGTDVRSQQQAGLETPPGLPFKDLLDTDPLVREQDVPAEFETPPCHSFNDIEPDPLVLESEVQRSEGTIEPQSDAGVDVADVIKKLSVLFGDSGAKILRVVSDPDLRTEQKLWEMERIDKPLMASITSAEKLGSVLGVSGTMIRKCSWWIERRQKRSQD